LNRITVKQSLPLPMRSDVKLKCQTIRTTIIAVSIDDMCAAQYVTSVTVHEPR